MLLVTTGHFYNVIKSNAQIFVKCIDTNYVIYQLGIIVFQ